MHTSARPGRATAQRMEGRLHVLRELHDGRISTRAELTTRLGLSRASALEITARLREAALVHEEAAPPDGRRGRPTTRLLPHPEGPLVCAVDIAHETWTVAVVELGGAVLARTTGQITNRDADSVLGVVRGAVAGQLDAWGARVRAVPVSVPGTVRGTRVAQASNLRWRDVDLSVLADLPVLGGNDATLSGLAESRRGAAVDADVALHLKIDVGVGGILVVNGTPMTGATGGGGEFGHLPFGDPRRRCLCGAYGCWDTEVDGRALARLAWREDAAEPRAAAERVLGAARDGDAAAARAVDEVARAFGRGIGGLVNALDPRLVTVSGVATDLLAAAPEAFGTAYRAGLIAHQRTTVPPVRASALGADGSLIGAAETGFDHVLTESGITAWRAR
ncbi:ROK family protein [Allokutzneria sp. A3M-2-11 16]|uniref:ROK family transcriptional regulator n=1 Tax=Allokutzneria sp. A3M-2-11 16 TaxID=2962043 RepID=UPI0020B886F2|nr:ROK family transcriptional regulator [Allokutzneria sp. A3M-2-11 16]MCP3801460.1 ROK family protein [Allokutzneria sp. A3M-2-11 16]